MELLNTIAAGLLISVVTSVITVRLALGRYYSERWWERRLDAYTRVHDALSVQLKQTKAESDAMDYYYSELYRTGEARAKPVPDAVAEELRKNWRESERELEDALIRGAFLLSEDAVGLLRRYQQERRKIELSMRDLQQESIEALLAAAQDAVDEFGKLAKRDLGIARPVLVLRARPLGPTRSVRTVRTRRL